MCVFDEDVVGQRVNQRAQQPGFAGARRFRFFELPEIALRQSLLPDSDDGKANHQRRAGRGQFVQFPAFVLLGKLEECLSYVKVKRTQPQEQQEARDHKRDQIQGLLLW